MDPYLSGFLAGAMFCMALMVTICAIAALVYLMNRG